MSVRMPNKEENRVTVFVAQRKQCRCQEWLELAGYLWMKVIVLTCMSNHCMCSHILHGSSKLITNPTSL